MPPEPRYLRDMRGFPQDPPDFVRRVGPHADLVRWRMGPFGVCRVNTLELVRDLPATQAAKFYKSRSPKEA